MVDFGSPSGVDDSEDWQNNSFVIPQELIDERMREAQLGRDESLPELRPRDVARKGDIPVSEATYRRLEAIGAECHTMLQRMLRLEFGGDRGSTITLSQFGSGERHYKAFLENGAPDAKITALKIGLFE